MGSAFPSVRAWLRIGGWGLLPSLLGAAVAAPAAFGAGGMVRWTRGRSRGGLVLRLILAWLGRFRWSTSHSAP